MTINGIPSGVGGSWFPTGPSRRESAKEASQGQAPRPDHAAAANAAVRGLAATGIGGEVEAPQGTDPALWKVLTAEERTFFARTRAMGPLMYGRGSDQGALPGVRLGGRIDVKV